MTDENYDFCKLVHVVWNDFSTFVIPDVSDRIATAPEGTTSHDTVQTHAC